MRKSYKCSLFLALLAFGGSTSVQAQSYNISGPFTGQGPLLNNESTSSSTGWTMVHAYNAHGGASVNSWSDKLEIGFPFSFYGAAVDTFLVSKNFLLTFTKSLTTQVVDSNLIDNTSLPNVNMPPNTIAYTWCGFGNPAPISSGDDIWIKTFGMAPNRQLWVKHFSFECEGQSFVYNFVVLEESTNKIYVVDARNATVSASTRTVGVQLNTTTAVQDPVSPNIASINGNVTSPWPNVSYWVIEPLLPNDVTLFSVDAPTDGCALGVNETASVRIVNNGINTQTSIPVMYSLNGGAFVSAGTWTGTLASKDTTTHTFQVNASAVQTHNLVVATNLSTDGNNLNDTNSLTFVNYPIYAIADSVMICSGDSFVFPDATVQTNITAMTFHTSNLSTIGFGCDSIITTTVYVNPDVYDLQESVDVCYGESFTFPDGSVLVSADTMVIHVSNLTTLGFGCDSIIETTVNVNTVDTSVNIAGTTLTANASGAMYRWLDCNNFYQLVSPGDTNQAFTATANGRYAVEVVQNNCVDTSGCFLFSTIGINENGSGDQVYTFPNPTEGQITVALGTEFANSQIQIFNLQGKIVFETIANNRQAIEIHLDQPAGTYILKLKNAGKVHTEKINLQIGR